MGTEERTSGEGPGHWRVDLIPCQWRHGTAFVICCPQVLKGGELSHWRERYVHHHGGVSLPSQLCINCQCQWRWIQRQQGWDASIPRVGDGCGGGTSKEEMTLVFEKYLNAKKVIWLSYGVDGEDYTNGHVDNLAAFMTSCGRWQSGTWRMPMTMNPCPLSPPPCS
jgi:hypothetical protein